MQKNKKLILILSIVLFLIIVTSLYFLYVIKIKKDKYATPLLTEEERIKILNELDSEKVVKPITVEERKDVLKGINSVKIQKPITEEERNDILRSLYQ